MFSLAPLLKHFIGYFFLTPWSRVLFEKLIVAQVVKKYPHLLMIIYLKIYYHVHNSL
jgi:hypothetical protein